MLVAMLLAVSHLSTEDIREFFTVPGWCDYSVTAEATPGDCSATNLSRRISEGTGSSVAAVYAPFAAFCERAYYPSSGLRNVWDETEYGPISDNQEFRFALPTNSPSPFYYAPDTNRTVLTRRFIEWGNLDALADNLALCGSGGIGGLGDLFYVYRPSWTNSSWMLWSSTAFGELGGIDFPYLYLDSRRIDAIATPSEWSAVCPGFNRCAAPIAAHGDTIDWRGDRNKRETMAYMAWNRCNFGEPPFNMYYWCERYVPQFSPLTATAADVVRKAFEIDPEHHLVTNVVQFAETNTLYYGVEKFGNRTLVEHLSAQARADFEYYSPANDAIISFEFLQFQQPSYWHVRDDSIYIEYDVRVTEILNSNAFCQTMLTINSEFEYHHSYVPQQSELSVAANSPSKALITYAWTAASSDLTLIGDLNCSSNLYPFKIGTIVINGEQTNITDTACIAALTNDTRRLFRNRLAAVDQCLGALDRTYHGIDYDVTHTNGTGNSSLSYVYSRNVNLDWENLTTDGAEGKISGWTLDTNGCAVVGGRSDTSRNGTFTTAMTPTESSFSASEQLSLTLKYWAVDASEIKTLIGMHTNYAVDVAYSISGGNLLLSAVFTPISGGTPLQLTDGASLPLTATVGFCSSMNRTYQYRYPFALSIADIQPGQFSRSHFKGSTICCVADYADIPGTEVYPMTTLTEPAWVDDARPQNFFKHTFQDAYSWTSPYYVKLEIETAILHLKNIASQKFSERTGAAADDVASQIPCLFTMMSDAANNVEFTEMDLLIQQSQGCDEVYVDSQNRLWALLPDGTWETVASALYLATFNLSNTKTYPEPDDHPLAAPDKYGCNESMKLFPFSKLDWNWQSLRKTGPIDE